MKRRTRQQVLERRVRVGIRMHVAGYCEQEAKRWAKFGENDVMADELLRIARALRRKNRRKR